MNFYLFSTSTFDSQPRINTVHPSITCTSTDVGASSGQLPGTHSLPRILQPTNHVAACHPSLAALGGVKAVP